MLWTSRTVCNPDTLICLRLWRSTADRTSYTWHIFINPLHFFQVGRAPKRPNISMSVSKAQRHMQKDSSRKKFHCRNWNFVNVQHRRSPRVSYWLTALCSALFSQQRAGRTTIPCPSYTDAHLRQTRQLIWFTAGYVKVSLTRWDSWPYCAAIYRRMS